jgi:hypothetical protein
MSTQPRTYVVWQRDPGKGTRKHAEKLVIEA